MRVLIVAHGHPDYSVGGAEMAAYSLFRALGQDKPDDTFFLSSISSQRVKLHAPDDITRLDPGRNEWLLHGPESDWIYQSSKSRSIISRSLIRFLREIRPDVIHFHHYMDLSLEAIRLVRRALPDCRIVLTLHEYLAICLRDGQMITRLAGKLCQRASPVRCSGCFPEVGRSQFALRELWYKRHFDLVDGFISPSEFLKERYVAWGMDPRRIEVIENAQICTLYANQRKDLARPPYRTFAFFGRMDRYKGIEMVLQAADSIARHVAAAEELPRILLYGTIAREPRDYREQLEAAIAAAPSFVEFRGPYDMSEVISLMSSVGWVIVPSTWWENSPVVIEEAFFAGRPIICSDIGGMAEKVTHGVNGLHFRVRDPDDLAQTILAASQAETMWRDMASNVRRVPSLAETGALHVAYYQRLSPRTGFAAAEAA